MNVTHSPLHHRTPRSGRIVDRRAPAIRRRARAAAVVAALVGVLPGPVGLRAARAQSVPTAPTAPTAPVASTAPVALEHPVGGWRVSPTETRGFVQEVNYPASNVNAVRAPTTALIRGHLQSAPKRGAGSAGRPARLVVDGIALPLAVDADGRFERPWSFGRGTHGVEVRPADGSPPLRSQFLEAGGPRPPRLRIALSWDSDGTDVDLHVVSPDGSHVFYGQRVAPYGGALDVDVTTGYGPEIFASPLALPGIWHVYVNYYGAGERQDVITVAQIAVITDEGTPAEVQRVVRVPLRKPGELTRAYSFRMAGP